MVKSSLFEEHKSADGSSSNPDEFELLDRYWKASNYLAVGQIYLLESNPLLKKPLQSEDVKRRLLGHFGTTPGQNFIYVHLNRLIRERELECIFVSGPGHGGPAVVAQTYLEGTYSEVYPQISRDEVGLGKLFKQFSFPGGIPSHVAPDTPGSIHEGGELGYSLSHSFGAVLDKPNLTVACVVGDGEAETGPLATSWHANKFLNPKTDGAVLPILHLNGYKIANPCILARIPRDEIMQLFRGYGYDPIVVEGSDPAVMHPAFAQALETCFDKIQAIQKKARTTEPGKLLERPIWPMIILKSPKGWTGPASVDGVKIEGSYHAHQVPLSDPRSNKDHRKILQEWLMSYEPHKQFDSDGKLVPELQELAPEGKYRMSANAYTNPKLKPLVLPDFLKHGIEIDTKTRGTVKKSDTYTVGTYLREVFRANDSFRMFGPDETASNRLHAVYDTAKKQWMGEHFSDDDDVIAQEGKVMEMLSEHQCEGWLEGYLLTGGHGLLNSYEAFIHIISSMFNQHTKWLEATNEIEWRHPLPSLNILLASHVWRQDHNGFTHQDPGFLQHVATKKPEIVRIYLPPDANCLLSVMNHMLSSQHKVNVVTAGKHPSPQWLTPQEAHEHCAAGVGIWEWASTTAKSNAEPDLIIAAAGDATTHEALAAISILKKKLPKLGIRMVNVVDLMRLHTPDRHPHGLKQADFDSMFTANRPVLFNFHAYPQMIHNLIFGRTNQNFLVRGYVEEGTITTPFDMCVMNGTDRFHLVQDACDLMNASHKGCSQVRQEMKQKLIEHKEYIEEYGVDMPEIEDWEWSNN